MLIQSNKSTGFLGACRAATAPFAFFADRGVKLNRIINKASFFGGERVRLLARHEIVAHSCLPRTK